LTPFLTCPHRSRSEWFACGSGKQFAAAQTRLPNSGPSTVILFGRRQTPVFVESREPCWNESCAALSGPFLGFALDAEAKAATLG